MRISLAVLIGLSAFAGLLWGTGASATKPTKLERFRDGGKIGFTDSSGAVVLAAVYDDAGDFAFGLAPVNIGARQMPGPGKMGGKWGYIDTRGKVLVPVTLECAMEFSDGLALVGDEKGMRYIDTDGKTVVQLENGASGGQFCEGLAAVRLVSEDETRYIDKRGQVIFVVKGSGSEFHEGMAVLVVSEGRQYKYGFIDKTGKMVIDAKYNQAWPFWSGTARVHIGGELRQISDMAPHWEGGEWLRIDKKGNVVERGK